MILRQDPHRIFNQVESRDPLYNENPPKTPWMFLNSTSGELFTCVGNEIGANYWNGNLGSNITPRFRPLEEVEYSNVHGVEYIRDIVVALGNVYGSDVGHTKLVKFGVASLSYISEESLSFGLDCLGFDDSDLHGAQSDRVYAGSGVSGSFSLLFNSTPNTANKGLTFVGGNRVLGCSSTDSIFVYEGNTSNVSTTFSAPAGAINGLTFDGTNLISCDSGTNRIYVHDGVSENILFDFPSPSGDIESVAFDGTNLISSDYSLKTFFRHKVGTY